MTAEYGLEDLETGFDEVPRSNTRDWLYHANQSLFRLKDVKKNSYSLGGGPREREVNCKCNYRSKHKSSFLCLEAEPPQLTRDSQETASMPDLSVPEIMRQFNERQTERSKQKRRPYSSTVHSSKGRTRKGNIEEREPSFDYNAFISVKGQTVTPQSRPPPGTVSITESRAANIGYKGLVHLDKHQLEQEQKATFAGLRRYSAAFGDDEESSSAVPPPPRASPEPSSPSRNSFELQDSADESFSEEENVQFQDDHIDKTSENRSECSESMLGSRSLIFAIPTAGSDAGSDEDEVPSDFQIGRLSADYVATSDTLLSELTEKRRTEAAEISDLIHDMEDATERINNLRVTPRDLEMESITSRSGIDEISETPVSTSGTKPHFRVISSSVKQNSVGQHKADSGLYETFWVEEPFSPDVPNSLPVRAGRCCSARFLSKHSARPARVSKHQSESSLVLKGKTVEFFDFETLAAKNLLCDIRRNSVTDDGLKGIPDSESNVIEEKIRNRGDTGPLKKVSTKPPLPKSHVSKTKKQSSRAKHASDAKTSENTAVEPEQRFRRSSLKKSNSEGNIPRASAEMKLLQSEVSTSSKKSVKFSEDVLAESRSEEIDASCVATGNFFSDVDSNLDVALKHQQNGKSETVSNQLERTCSLSSPGFIIQNGLEMKEQEFEGHNSCDTTSSLEPAKAGRQTKTNQSTRAKILAKAKEHSCEEEACHCRTVTRPTAALLEEARRRRIEAEGMPSVSSLRKEKLLKQRPARPSSAPIKRTQANVGPVERPKSPRRKPRVMSATVQRKRTNSQGSQGRPRPASAHVGRIRPNDVQRSQAAAKVLKEGYLFKERPPHSLPPGSKQKTNNRDGKEKLKEKNSNSAKTEWNKEDEQVAASEECHEIFARLQEKGIEISMETLKRGLMAPARRASELSLATIGSSSGLLSRPENWLPEEHARVKIWDDVLKHAN